MARGASREAEHDYAVDAAATFKLDTYRGAVDVKASDDGKIHVKIFEDVANTSDEAADRLFKRIEVQEKAAPGEVSIVVRNPAETRIRFVWDDPQRVDINYAVLVPRRCNLVLVTNDGGISVGDLSGGVDAKAKKGVVFLRQIDGNVRVNSDSGDIIISRCLGSVDLRARSGNVRMGTLRGGGDIRTTSGDIEVQHSRGGLFASTDEGDVTVGFEGEFHKDSKIDTNGGAITVRLDPAMSCQIRASSVWGRVHTTLPVALKSGGDGKRSLDGILNGGGRILALHANGGQIHIDPPRI